MIASSLVDLDELVLKCRDQKPRAYIAEAVASYRAGAYRATIVSTWIAVCYDIIDKLRELALSGDPEAEIQVAALERTRASNDLGKALQFERGLLELARDKFELISHLEFVDLERLQADRNRCAHPSLVADDQAYSPSAELARVHLHSAVHHLMQHPPVQGKYALARLIKEVDSELFPTDTQKAITAFSSGPLRKPRESLVRNFAVVLLKRLLQEAGLAGRKRPQARAAFAAVLSMHEVQVEAVLKDRLSSLVRNLEDEHLGRVISFLEETATAWAFMEKDVRLRMTEFVEKLPESSFMDLDFILKFEAFKASGESRVRRATRSELSGLFFLDTPSAVVNRVIQLYLGSKSFEHANANAKLVEEYLYDLDAARIEKIVAGVAKNEQVNGSFGLGALLKLLRNGKIPDLEFDELLKANELSEHVPVQDDDDIPF